MLRETTFLIGGGLMITLGVVLAVGLYLSGVGAGYLDTWLACGLSVVLGVFFVHVARGEHRDRRAFLEQVERPPNGPPGAGPG